MPSFCSTPLKPATQDAQNSVGRFWISGGGIGVPPGTGVSLIGKMDPASYQIFSGNGIAVASMCAGSHKYRPSRDQTGGLTGKVDISPEMGPTVCTLFAQIPTVKDTIKPYNLVSDCRALSSISRGARIRTGDPLLPKQVRYRTAPRPEDVVSRESKRPWDFKLFRGANRRAGFRVGWEGIHFASLTSMRSKRTCNIVPWSG